MATPDLRRSGSTSHLPVVPLMSEQVVVDSPFGSEDDLGMGDDRLPGTGLVGTVHWVCPRDDCDEDDWGSSVPTCQEHDEVMIEAKA